MALAAITQEQITEGSKQLDDDFAYLLETKGVSSKLRGAFGHLGVKKINIFARLASSDEKFREMLVKRFGLDETASMEDTVQVALLVDVWESARDRILKQTALESQAAAEGLPPVLPKGQNMSMRRSYEAAFDEVDEDVYPAKDYLSWRAEQLEDNEFRAEPLTEVLSVNDAAGDNEDVKFAMVQGGNLRLKKTKSTIPMPMNAEELRARYRVMWVHWEVTRMRFPERDSLKGMGREVLEKVLDYILGKQVASYKTSKNVRLGWPEVLEYELEIRKLACKRVNQGKDTMANALLYAIKDNELRTHSFVTPLAVSGHRGRSRTPRRDTRRDNTNEREGGKGKGGAKGKGKGKGKGGSKASGSADRDDNADNGWGKIVNQMRKNEKVEFSIKKGVKWLPKCIRYNKGICREPACRFEHVCLRCGGAHPVPECGEPAVRK